MLLDSVPSLKTSSITLTNQEPLTMMISQSLRTPESVTLLNTSQELRSLLLVATPKTSFSLLVMLMESCPQSLSLTKNKLCIISSVVTLLRSLELKLESKTPFPRSQHALVRLSSPCIPLPTLRCWQNKLRSMELTAGSSTPDGAVVNMVKVRE